MSKLRENTLNYIKPNIVSQTSFPDISFNPLSANHTKWSYTLKQFVGCCYKNCCGLNLKTHAIFL